MDDSKLPSNNCYVSKTIDNIEEADGQDYSDSTIEGTDGLITAMRRKDKQQLC